MEEQRLAEESEFQSFLLKLLNDHKTELVNFSANSLITSYSPLYSIAPYTYSCSDPHRQLGSVDPSDSSCRDMERDHVRKRTQPAAHAYV